MDLAVVDFNCLIILNTYDNKTVKNIFLIAFNNIADTFYSQKNKYQIIIVNTSIQSKD